MHSILITGSTLNDRLKTANQHAKTDIQENLDIKILKPHPSITIKQVRQIETFLSKKPYQNHQNLVLVTQAETLTVPAQNALLKTLEEPPKNSLIILLAPNQSKLLETITSRCQIISLKNLTQLTPKNLQDQKNLFNSIIKLSLSERINLAGTIAANKIEAIKFCQLQLLFLKENLTTHQKIIKKLTLSLDRLNANLNPKLVLESLFFSYQT